MNRRISRGAVLLLAAAMSAGLAGCTRFNRPEVRLQGARLGSVGLQGGRLYVQLEVTNPNGFELRTDGLRYDMQLKRVDMQGDHWVPFADGEYTEEIRVPANDRITVEVPIEFRYSEIGGALQEVLDRGYLDYKVSGKVELSRPFHRDIPFERTGTVEVAS